MMYPVMNSIFLWNYYFFKLKKMFKNVFSLVCLFFYVSTESFFFTNTEFYPSASWYPTVTWISWYTNGHSSIWFHFPEVCWFFHSLFFCLPFSFLCLAGAGMSFWPSGFALPHGNLVMMIEVHVHSSTCSTSVGCSETGILHWILPWWLKW